MARLYSNENFPQPVVIALRERGHDVLSLHRVQPDHAGIIVCTLDADFSGQAERIDAVLQTCPNLTNQLLRVNRPA